MAFESPEAKLKFQYATVLDLGKFMYDSYFKLATMSFTLNGLLLASVSFLLAQAGKIPEGLFNLGIAGIAVIGEIYNIGALLTYLSLVTLAGNLSARFAQIDHLLDTDVRSCRSPMSDRLGYFAVGFTLLFFALWITLWAYLLYAHYKGDSYLPGIAGGPPSASVK